VIWRAGTGFLIDGPFRLIDATGTISRRFEDSATEDGLDVDLTTYVIREGRLIEVTTMERMGWETLPAERETIVLDGLMEDPSDEAACFVATALGDRAVLDDEQRLRDERAAKTR